MGELVDLAGQALRKEKLLAAHRGGIRWRTG
jgi:hypothetical protein